MEKKKFSKMIGLILIFILLQTYFQNENGLYMIISKWKGYFIPLIWAVFITLLLDPVVIFFENKLKIKKLFAVILAIIFMFLILIILLIMVIPQLVSSIKELNSVYPYLSDKAIKISEDVFSYLEKKNILSIDVSELNKNITNIIKNNMVSIQNFILSVFKNIMKMTVNLTNFFLGLFLAFFLLLNKKVYLKTRDNIIILLFGHRRSEYVIKKLKQSKEIFIAYIAGKILVSFVVGLSVFIVLIITGTPYASLSAVLLGVGNMIPYIGSIVGGIIAGFLIFIVSPIKIIFLLVAIGISQLLDGFIIGPKIIGDKVGLDSFWVMVSMIIFGGLWGITGMFLGIPIMCIIKILYRDALKRVNEKKEEVIE